MKWPHQSDRVNQIRNNMYVLYQIGIGITRIVSTNTTRLTYSNTIWWYNNDQSMIQHYTNIHTTKSHNLFYYENLGWINIYPASYATYTLRVTDIVHTANHLWENPTLVLLFQREQRKDRRIRYCPCTAVSSASFRLCARKY